MEIWDLAKSHRTCVIDERKNIFKPIHVFIHLLQYGALICKVVACYKRTIQLEDQYFVGNPFAWMTDLRRRCMLSTSCVQKEGVITWCHAWIMAEMISERHLGVLSWITRPTVAQRFSIGLISGLCPGQSLMCSTSLVSSHCLMVLARWQGALSSWKIAPCSGYCSRRVCKNSFFNTSRYTFWFTRSPFSKILNRPTPLWEKHPQTITLTGCLVVAMVHFGR